jgi:propionyl-CoA synthetase
MYFPEQRHLQDDVHKESLQNPEEFWMHQAEQLYWHKKPERAIKMGKRKLKNGKSHTSWEWFPGGEISTCYNAVDRHVLAGRGTWPAIHYDSPVTKTKRTITYANLLEDVEVTAGFLREQGVKKGDVVLVYSEFIRAWWLGAWGRVNVRYLVSRPKRTWLSPVAQSANKGRVGESVLDERRGWLGTGTKATRYWRAPHPDHPPLFAELRVPHSHSTALSPTTLASISNADNPVPQIPAAVTAILATNRLGATHCVVFGGFSGSALGQRIDAVKPDVILTASCGIDGTKAPIPYAPLVHEGIREATHKPQRVIVYQREQVPWVIDEARGERSWQNLWLSAKARGVRAEAVPVASTDPCYISHTSGTTGAPKGVVRDSGGHAVGLHLSVAMVFGVPGPGGCIFAASDIGWVLGHAFIMMAPLLAGAATVLYEGKPIGTPDASAFWRIINEYDVTMLYCAPTALRAIKRDDPDARYMSKFGEKGGLRSLKGLFLAGERSEPSLIVEYQEFLNQWAAPGAQVIDNWWSTEVGSPITSRTLMPHAGFDRTTKIDNHPPALLKPGSAGKAMPGYNIQIVDDDGKPVAAGEMGNIVLGLPLPPTAFRTLWQDDERFYKGYLERFGGELMDTGDAGYIDKDGYVHVMARNDDVLNVSAHRLSSAAIEQALASHPLVAEGCVVAIPDALKGELPFAFVTLAVPDHPTSAIPDEQLQKELQGLVRSGVGAIASLGGVIQGSGMIPKTRSGKTLRRVLRELLANAAEGDFDAAVTVPSTVEDITAVEVARQKIREYFQVKGAAHKAVHTRAPRARL